MSTSAVDRGHLARLLEPPRHRPGLEIHLSSLVDVVLIEEFLHLVVPLREGLGHPSKLNAVEPGQVWTVAVESTQVDDAHPISVELPVLRLVLGMVATNLSVAGRDEPFPELQRDFLQILHDEVKVEVANDRLQCKTNKNQSILNPTN